ncbi:hypothetical protein [Pseudomonas sessilinigenes]|uniref:Uncharacterized protein n=1 Tax=Pseudomonas sessilinigenes TaxID=658629 RepID=A0ABX8MH78_9PSED|nr:hypothetical protein [Pseudomonas sessilinigenes]QXH37877.1 hypothetical protein KSS89_16415 [Pseudomonas sessilinigenes]
MSFSHSSAMDFGTQLMRILDIRTDYEKAEITGDAISSYQAEIEAHIAGKEAQLSNKPSTPALFKNVPALNKAWMAGTVAAINGGGWSRVDPDDITPPIEPHPIHD